MTQATESLNPPVFLAIDDSVATITIDRPRARNAIALATMDELDSALDEVVAAAPSVLVLRGAGEQAFVSGGDLKDLANLQTLEQAGAMACRMRDVLDRIAQLPFPTIAAVNGHALGGGAEVSIACDLRVCADDVTLGFVQAQLAIMPAWGGVERLVELIGRSRAIELMATRRRVGAAEAKALGLVNEAVARAEFDTAVQAYARQIAEVPAEVLTSIKTVANLASPNCHPGSRKAAVDAFAELWVADAHWDAVGGRPSQP